MTAGIGRRTAVNIAAGLATLVLYSPMFLLKPYDIAPLRRGSAPLAVLRYWPVADPPGSGTNTVDVRIVWSPALFSLPSRVGFHTPSEGRHEVGPLFDLASPPHVRITPAAEETFPPAIPLPSWPAPQPVPEISRPPVFTPNPSLRLVEQLHVIDEPLRARLQEAMLEAPGADADQPWEAVLWIRFDEAGWPLNILLDRLSPADAPPALAEKILATARRWRAAPGSPAEGHVVIRCIHAPRNPETNEP